MTVSTTTRALLATAAFALLAGCAGSSQVAPSTVGSQSHMTKMAKGVAMIAPGRYATQQHQAFQDIGGRKSFQIGDMPNKVCKKDCYNLVLGSDNVYGDLDIFTGASSSPAAAYIGTAASYGGWGVASYGNDEFAVGSSTYDIIVGNFSVSGSTLFLNVTAQLKGTYFSSGENAYGLAFDSKGNLYGNNWPTGSCLDEWHASTIAGYSGSPLSPDATFCSSKMAYIYQMGIHGATIYGDGYDPNFAQALDTITKFSKEKVTEDPITNSLGGFPGGVAVTTKGEVYVDDQYGTIFGYKAGKGAANQSVNWGFDPNDFTGINLDYSQANLWAADINFPSSGLYTTINDNSAPLGSASTLIGTPASSANHEYLGIGAVSAQK